jgi:hypothetical protein
MNNLSKNMTNLANTLVVEANKSQSSGETTASTNALTTAVANVANTALTQAANINLAVETANKGVQAAKVVQPHSNALTGANKVMNTVNPKKSEIGVSAAIFNNANKVLSETTELNGQETAALVANAGVVEAVNMQTEAVENLGKAVKKLNAKIAATSPTNSKFASVVSANKEAMKKMIFTAEGNMRELIKTNTANVVNINGKKRVVVPKTAKIVHKLHNVKAKTTGKQVYKQGELRNIYKNKNGKNYTVMPGVHGNVRNYQNMAKSGLFSGKML